ncbi:MAG TPA: phenylalanine--tRNA ligase subunit beta, partial [Aquifex aeolicus]|nr:phenylalanine--tRNA ligase subunit beta [Aquifex aeolicus]
DPLVAEIRLDPLFAERLPHYRALSKYPPVVRDLALLVDKNLPVSKLLNEIKSHLGDKMEEAMVFDLYAGEKVGEGKKSVGVRVVLRSFEGSLSSEEANALIGSLIRRLRELLGVEIR